MLDSRECFIADGCGRGERGQRRKLSVARESGCGVTPGRVRQMIVDGELPSEKFGRDRMIRAEDLKLVEGRAKVGRPRNKPEPPAKKKKK